MPPDFYLRWVTAASREALVQYRDLPNEITEASGLVISLALGLLYCAIFVVSGIYFYFHGYRQHELWIMHDGRLPLIGAICGITLVLSSIYTFQMACLNRDLRFRAESFQNAIFSAAQAATGLSIALAAHWHPKIGVFALAVQPLVAQILGNAVIYHRHPFAWPRAFQFAIAAKMLNYGWKVTLAQYVATVQLTVISAIVVMIGGTYGAGIYGRATQISDMIAYNLMGSFDRLLHPLLRAVRDEQERFQNLFIRGCIAITLVGAFGSAWLLGTAPDLIRVALGPQWGDVPPLLRIICIGLAINGLGTMGFAVINALGKPLAWLRISLVNFVILLVMMGLFFPFKGHLNRPLLGVATIFMICQIIYAQSAWVWAIRTLRIEKRKLIGHVGRLVAAAAVACACILLTRHGLAHAPVLIRLITSSSLGFVVFLGLVFLVDREAILDFRNVVRRKTPAQPSVPQPDAPGQAMGEPRDVMIDPPLTEEIAEKRTGEPGAGV